MTTASTEQGPEVRACHPPQETGLRRAYVVVRAFVLWIISGIHFFTVCTILILMAIFVDPRKNDRPQRVFCRTIVRLAGAKLEVRRAPGFDPRRTSFFVVNHVNLFDPFVLYSVIPQFIRGLELESHFKIPVYGWLMKRFGNVPVPDVTRPSDLKRMWKLTKDALDSGVSLIVFPEGGRTRDGRVGPFKDGVFRMAQQFGYPIVPVSLVGSFEFNRKDSWILRRVTIVVLIHDTIESRDLAKQDVSALKERVRGIIARPIDEAMKG